ncbi:hypothetical protein [Actibacterium mucosum]|uniref:hypothetical protein n=1 Tax=Actibacterium mucosum TaxID=1087332 RepID=UPI001268B624|nr:hypothetical protein [Actibacterium mucosum]
MLNYVTLGAAFGVVSVGASGLLRSCAPSADIRAEHLPFLKIDIAQLEPGKDHRFLLDNTPLGIHILTDAELAQVNALHLGLDPWVKRNYPHPQMPATAENLIQPGPIPFVALWLTTEPWQIVVLGDGAGEYGGFFDPHRAGHYDVLGRIHKGIGHNLAVPYLTQISETVYGVYADRFVARLKAGNT